MTYEAIITPICNIRPHSNADRLDIGTVAGSQVVVSKGTIEGTLGIFFGSDGQLSHEFCAANNLYSHKELNSDPTKGGFFGNNRRVRAQKFRGEISDGFWVELTTLAFAGGDLASLKEGTTLTEFNGIPICNKYFTPATMKGMGGNGKTSKKGFKPSEFPYFKEHWDTGQLLQQIRNIPTGAILSITEKCHGTSARTGRMLRQKRLGRFKKLWNSTIGKLGPQFSNESWCYVTGTRRVVMDPKATEDKGYYSGKQFRVNLHNQLKSIGLHKGETIYYEIVGYDETGKSIMSSHGVSKDLVKKGIITKQDYENFVKEYGEQVTYSYGCLPCTYKILVYRITQTSDDGHVIELSFNQVNQRCYELGLPYVPVLDFPFIYNDLESQQLIDRCKELMEDRCSTMDTRHPREGVVVRVEGAGIDTHYKYKSLWFRILEGLVKESDTYIDTEEVS